MQIIKKRTPLEYTLYSVIIAVGILIDQVTKLLAVKLLMPKDTVPIIKDVLHLTYVENRGAAFGMFDDRRWLFMVPSVVMIVAMLIYLYFGYAETKLYAVSVSMIVSGGIGNMIDRTVLGYVVDFIDFRLINFAVFNGADSFVCVGGGLLVLALVRDLIKEIRAKSAKSTESGEEEK